MKKKFPGRALAFSFLFVSTFTLLFLALCSFSIQKIGGDFLKQLGMSKQGADEKITNSLLGGSVDVYGIKNVKNIALGNRKAITLDLLDYIKKHVSTPAFLKEYNEMRNREKPQENIAETPEQMRANAIANAKKSVASMEETVRKSDPAYKSMFEKSLADAKKNLQDTEDPNNKYQVAYKKNYPQLVKSFKDGYTRSLADWSAKYPDNQLLYVKKRLVEFMNVTKDIDFSAELTEKNGKKIFVNKEYERKDSRWKMAFRAGKEVVEPAREFVQKWMEEIQ
jgi:hypothetical protein